MVGQLPCRHVAELFGNPLAKDSAPADESKADLLAVLFTVPLLCHFCAVKGPQRVTQLHTENKEKPHCEAIFGLTMRF